MQCPASIRQGKSQENFGFLGRGRSASPEGKPALACKNYGEQPGLADPSGMNSAGDAGKLLQKTGNNLGWCTLY